MGETMTPKLRLLTVIGQAALLFTVTCFLLTTLGFLVLLPPGVRFAPPPIDPSFGEVAMLIGFFVAPAALASWWIFRKLRTGYPRRQALGTAGAFAIFSPVPLILGLVIGPLVGGYAGTLVGSESPLVSFSAAVLGIVATVTLMTLAPTLLALWLTRQTGGTAQAK